MIVVMVEVYGERKEAIKEGFKMLADYILETTPQRKKMNMTAPITNELSEKNGHDRSVLTGTAHG